MGTSESLVIITPENRQESFASQWTDYRDIIFDRKQLFGDYVVSDDGHGGYVLKQYAGHLDVNMADKTINGKAITSISDNAVIYDVTVEI